MFCHRQRSPQWRQSHWALWICIAALVLFTACAPVPLSAPTAEPKGGGGEFRVAYGVEPASLNPNLRIDDGAFIVAQNIFNKLVTLDADYRILPDLARSWEISEDGLTYTFHLAPDVRWHDGQPFTSADVKWSMEAIAAGKGGGQSVAARITQIDTPDATTVVLHLKEPWAPFIPMLAWYGTFILPQHVYASGDPETNPANDKPVGTGPFQFVTWVKGDHITLTANTSYFRRGPFLDQVTYRFVKDTTTAIDLLRQGEADYTLQRPTFKQVAEIEKVAGIKVRTFPHPARYYLGFNLRHKPFDDLRVRQAINMAVDRNALVETALLGYGAPATGFYTPAVGWAYNPQAQVPAFDTAGAVKLLDEAGITPGAGGTRLSIKLVTSKISPFTEIAPAIQAQLQPLGIQVTVNTLPSADFQKVMTEGRDFDLFLTDGSWGPDPENLVFRFGSKGSYQFMGYSSAEFDAAVAEGARLSKLDERARAYFRAQEILAHDLPLAPLAEYIQLLVMRDHVTGLGQTEARGLVTFNDYSLVRVQR